MGFRADPSLGTVDELLANTGTDAGAIRDNAQGSRDLVLVFRTKRDGSVRPEHAALEGRIWELDDPDAPNPPLAPNCRCEIVIEDRGRAAAQETTTPAQSLEKFKALENNLEKVYPLDVVTAYANGDLKPEDIIIKRTGDRITTDQARAIIASRKADADPKAALKAVSELADKGLSGRVLSPIVADARERMAQGLSARDAAREAIAATQKRGYVTPATVDKAADALVRSRLLEGETPPPKEATKPKPKPAPEPAPPPKAAVPGSREAAQSVIDEMAKIREETASAKEKARAASDQAAELMAHLDARTRAVALVMVPQAERTAAVIAVPKARQTKEIAGGVATFRSLVSKKVMPATRTATVVPSRSRRAFAYPDQGTVHLGKGTASQVTVHELGHLLEADPDIKRAAMEFLERRTTGEKAERLRDVTGIKAYGRNEITKKDGFFSPYVGKQYDDGFTEVVSMGLEKMAEDPAEFAKIDPDHFRFIYQLCRGTLEP